MGVMQQINVQVRVDGFIKQSSCEKGTMQQTSKHLPPLEGVWSFQCTKS